MYNVNTYCIHMCTAKEHLEILYWHKKVDYTQEYKWRYTHCKVTNPNRYVLCHCRNVTVKLYSTQLYTVFNVSDYFIAFLHLFSFFMQSYRHSSVLFISSTYSFLIPPMLVLMVAPSSPCVLSLNIFFFLPRSLHLWPLHRWHLCQRRPGSDREPGTLFSDGL